MDDEGTEEETQENGEDGESCEGGDGGEHYFLGFELLIDLVEFINCDECDAYEGDAIKSIMARQMRVCQLKINSANRVIHLQKTSQHDR